MDIGEIKKAIAVFHRMLNSEVPVGQLEIFLAVVEHDGINEQEIARQITLPRATFRRNLMRLTEQMEGAVLVPQGAGRGVCRVEDDGSVCLTEKGKQLARELLGAS